MSSLTSFRLGPGTRPCCTLSRVHGDRGQGSGGRDPEDLHHDAMPQAAGLPGWGGGVPHLSAQRGPEGDQWKFSRRDSGQKFRARGNDK